MLTYITVPQSPRYHQMTIDEFLFEPYNPHRSSGAGYDPTGTVTHVVEVVTSRFLSSIDVDALIFKLIAFNEKYENLRTVPRETLYNTFFIPKSHGGLRRIDAPEPALMEALRELKKVFEDDFHALYHTSAFAYIKHRSTIDSVKRHQSNESRWFAKLDLSNFFGSTTPEFLINQLRQIFPFSEVIKNTVGRRSLTQALDLAFLNGGLPQGTPLSPLLTNLMMIPVDFLLSNTLRDFEKNRFIYTRYADDFLISSKYDFNVRSVEQLIVETLSEFSAPFTLNRQKTRYGSSAGKNWNLGVMLNKDNQITVGYQKKKQFQAMLHNYINDRRSGNFWSREDIQTMQGYYSFYRMVEGDTIDRIVRHINEKMQSDVLAMIKEDLR